MAMAQASAGPPEISLILLCHNEAVFLGRALASVLAQDFSGSCEILLVDDGSQDGSAALAEAVLFPALSRRPGWSWRILRHETCRGNAAAFVTGLAAARGRYLHVLDADDYWIDPEKLTRQVQRLEADPSLAAIGHRTLVRSMATGSESLLPRRDPPRPVLEFGDFLREDWYFHTSAMLFRNQWGAGRMPPIFAEVRGDLVRLLVAASQGGIAWLPQTMSVYDDHGGDIWTALDAVGRRALVERLLQGMEDHGYLDGLGAAGRAYLRRMRGGLVGFEPINLLPVSIPPDPSEAGLRRVVGINRITSLGDLVAQAEALIAADQLEEALCLLEGFLRALAHSPVARLAERHRLSSPEIDGLAARIGVRLAQGMTLPPPSSRRDAPVILVTSVLDDSRRGRTLARLCRLFQAAGEVVIVMSTEIAPSVMDSVAGQAAHQAAAAGGQILLNTQGPLTEKAAWLLHHINRLAPARVIALPLPQDVALLAGLARGQAGQVALMDCVDLGYGPGRHSPAFGTLIVARPRDLALLAAEVPGRSLVLLPPEAALPLSGAHPVRLVTALAAQSETMLLQPYDYPYETILPLLLSDRSGVARHLHVGPLSPGLLNRIVKALLRAGINPARFVHEPDFATFASAVRRERVGALLQAFPLPDTEALQQAQALALPVILHDSYWGPLFLPADLASPGAPSWKTPADLVNILASLATGGLDVQGQRARLTLHLRQAGHSAARDPLMPVPAALIPPPAVLAEPPGVGLRRLLNLLMGLTLP